MGHYDISSHIHVYSSMSSVKELYIIWGEPEQAPNTQETGSGIIYLYPT